MAESVLVYPVKRKTRLIIIGYMLLIFFPRKRFIQLNRWCWAVFVDTQTGKVVLFETLLKPLGCCVPEDWVPPKPEEMKPKW